MNKWILIIALMIKFSTLLFDFEFKKKKLKAKKREQNAHAEKF